ncbi:tagaturonate reductase [Paenibacillus cellulositrophicus]|uniref:tagaturonate reductase n=1 Tax=Paenibacillus cellulositrophicus TaxID=562959 RepID=UPI003F7CEE13
MTPRLSRSLFPDLPALPERMIQFGGGNFMRAFVNWQMQQMNLKGLFNGSAVVVQPTAHGKSTVLMEQDGLYTVLLKGRLQGQLVNSSEVIATVSRVINPYTDYEAYLKLAEQDELEFITSNTTEAGIVYEAGLRREDAPHSSFPAKLTELLYRRFQLGKAGFIILPCELIEDSGEKLRRFVLQHAADWQLGDAFAAWVTEANTFCSCLVDRIVPGYPRDQADDLEQKLGYEDPFMVSAEPYHLWVIEGPAWLREKLPLAEAGLNVIVTDDLSPYRERKVHLLNGPHTAMVPLGLLAGLETVEDVMKDSDLGRFVHELMEDEILPVLKLPRAELLEYAAAIRERFNNPLIRHELASISLNSISKFTARLLPVLIRYQQAQGKLPRLLVLSFAALLLTYRGDLVARRDVPEVLEAVDRNWIDPESFVPGILKEERLWGMDLTAVPGLEALLGEHIGLLEREGVRASLHQLT